MGGRSRETGGRLVCGSPGESLLDTSEVWRCSAAGGPGQTLCRGQDSPHHRKSWGGEDWFQELLSSRIQAGRAYRVLGSGKVKPPLNEKVAGVGKGSE